MGFYSIVTSYLMDKMKDAFMITFLVTNLQQTQESQKEVPEIQIL